MNRLPCAACAMGVFWVVMPAADIDAEELQPLDTRTRCIVLFRETLVLIYHRIPGAVLANVADGGSSSRYRTFPDGAVPRGSDLERELKDPAQFFKHNFRRADIMRGEFDKIRFGKLKSEIRNLTIVEGTTASTREITLHAIPVAIPGLEDEEYSALHFVDVDGRLYWIPPGW